MREHQPLQKHHISRKQDLVHRHRRMDRSDRLRIHTDQPHAAAHEYLSSCGADHAVIRQKEPLMTAVLPRRCKDPLGSVRRQVPRMMRDIASAAARGQIHLLHRFAVGKEMRGCVDVRAVVRAHGKGRKIVKRAVLHDRQPIKPWTWVARVYGTGQNLLRNIDDHREIASVVVICIYHNIIAPRRQ